MAQYLTKNEVNALLSAVLEDETPLAQKKPRANNSLGFKSKITSAFVPELEFLDIAFSKISRSLRAVLGRYSSESINLTVSGRSVTTFNDYVNSIPLPACFCKFNTKNSRHSFGLYYDRSLFGALIEIFLGGELKAEDEMQNNDFTKIDFFILRQINKIFSRQINKAFKSHEPNEYEFDLAELNPQYSTIANKNEIVFIYHFEVQLEDFYGKFKIIFPRSYVESLLDQKKSSEYQSKYSSKKSFIKMSDHLSNLDCKMKVRLSNTIVSAQQVAALEVGDIIKLGNKATLLVNNESKFKGEISINNNEMNFKVRSHQSGGSNHE